MLIFLLMGMAIVLDLLIGDPPNWPHPVRFMGWGITRLEKWLRKLNVNLYGAGVFLLVFMVILVVLVVETIRVLSHPILFNILQVYLLYTCLAARCLANESKKIHRLLKKGDVMKAREQVSYIVGRDTAHLNEGEIAKATIETVAENTIDGVIAPLFYMLLGAPLGMSVTFALIYKVVNTLDSMVGYVQPPYKEIGWASAKCDDVLNFVPARLGAMLMIVSGALLGKNHRRGWAVFKRDRKNHKSPNSGHPEAVVAGLLGIRIGGVNTYFGVAVEKPTLGDATNELRIDMIDDVIKLMYVTEVMLFIIFTVFVMFFDMIMR